MPRYLNRLRDSFVVVPSYQVLKECQDTLKWLKKRKAEYVRQRNRIKVKFVNRWRRRFYWMGLKPVTKKEAIEMYKNDRIGDMLKEYEQLRSFRERSEVCREFIAIAVQTHRVFMCKRDFCKVFPSVELKDYGYNE